MHQEGQTVFTGGGGAHFSEVLSSPLAATGVLPLDLALRHYSTSDGFDKEGTFILIPQTRS